MKRHFLIGLILSLCTTAASAQGVLYECDVTQKKKDLDWISDKVGIVVKADGHVMVTDAVILHFNKRPMPATLVRDTPKRLDIRWTLTNTKDDRNQSTPHFDYTAQVNKKNMKFAIYGKPENFPNRFVGKGTCRVRKGK